ncbi:MAG: glycosyltransferase family 2 protein, partial [Ferruginibacter sp.]
LDNSSSDDSVSELKAAYPDLKLITTHSNLGYAGAHKLAAKLAVKDGFDLLWILNNDVEVLTNSLTELVNAYQENGDGLFGSVSLETDKMTISFAGGLEVLDDNRTEGHSGYNVFAGKNIHETELNERPVSGLEGASFMIPVNVILKYGFMDTRYFMYGEETAYCYRLRNEFNIQSILVPLSLIIHRNGGSFQKSEKLQWVRSYYTTRNGNLVHKQYQKDLEITDMSFKKIMHYSKFFLKHFFFIAKDKMDFAYWNKYYKVLGGFHSMLRLKGKYLKPENFLQ